MRNEMAEVRKTPPNPTAPAVVSDIRDLRRRAAGPRRNEQLAAPKGDVGWREHAARLEALKQQIARGEYNPDPEEIAQKMIERGF
jgi:anti-sigma28 factor (negative regulator of flagellin synthesis)